MSTTSVGQIGLDLVVNQNQFNRQMAGVQSLAKKTGKLLVAAFGVKQLVNYSKQCIELASDLQEVQNVADVAFPNMTAQMDKFAKGAAASFGLSETMAKKYSSLYGTMAKQFGFTEQSAYEMGTTLAGLAGDVASFYNMTQDEAYTKLKSVFSGETETLKDIGVVMTQSALDAYALANGYGKITSKMSETEKVALRYAYVQDQLSAASGDFLRTSDSWANQTRLLKLNLEQLGSTIGGTLINAFKPLVKTINSVIVKFTEFARAVSDSLGKIFGWTYEESGGGIASDLETGAGSADDIASGIGNAAENAKKLKQQLRGIDELNVISTSNNDDSNGSVSGGVGNSSSGQWVKTDSILKGYESDLDSLEELGEHISSKLRKSLERINWDDVYQSVENFGKGFANFLNGLIEPETFGAVGKTIAGALNTSIKLALSFGKTFDFKEFGESIATGINDFFATFDFKDLADCLNTWVDGLEDIIAGILETVEWEDILKKTGQFLGDLEIDTVGVIIGGFVLKKVGAMGVVALLSNAVKKAVSGGITLEGITVTLNSLTLAAGGPAFDMIISNLVWKLNEETDKLIPDWGRNFYEKLVQGIAIGAVGGSWIPGLGTIAGGIIGGIIGALEGIKIDGESILHTILSPLFNFDYSLDVFAMSGEFFQKVEEAWENEDWLSVGENVLKGIGMGIWGALSFLVEPIGDLFFYIYDGICQLFGIESPAKKMKPLGENIVLGIIEGFSSKFDKMKEKIKTFRSNIENWWKTNKPNLSAIDTKIKLPRLKVTWDTQGWAAEALQKLGLKGFPNFSVSYYAQGGFPEDGWFRAKHGEIMGKFDNGKSVVANNNQITEGISSAVYRGNRESNELIRQEIALLKTQNELLMGILEKENGISPDDIFNSVRKSADSYTRRTGNPAFSY